MKKPFRDTKVGKFLASKGVDSVLDIASNVIPGAKAINTLKDVIIGSPLSPEDKAQALDLLIQEKEIFSLEIQDRSSARNREIEIAKTGKKEWVQPIVVCSVLLMFMAMLAFQLFGTVPPGNIDAVREFQITLRDMMFMVVAYYVGSSIGSKKKTDLLKSE